MRNWILAPVGFKRFLQRFFHGAAIARFHHVDEVDDDKPGQVAQAQLAGHFGGGFNIGFGGGFFDVALAGGTSGFFDVNIEASVNSRF